MKLAVIIAGIAQVASAHYFFDKNIIDGVATASNKYIRASTRATKYNPTKFSSNPAADIRDGSYIDGPDARCNQGAFTNAAKTDVMTVAAGSEIKFQLAVGAKMQHPGPGLVYMSRAPSDDVKSYDGSGDWFKIWEEDACSDTADFTTVAWCTYNRDWIAATIPKDTPNGEYLVRVEHIGIHKSFMNQPEHYVSCAQVKVTGGGSGTPGPMVKFPGAYKDTDGYATFSIYNGHKDFPQPGPVVWGGNGTSSASGSGNSNPSSSAGTVKTTTLVTSVRSTASSRSSSVKPTSTTKSLTSLKSAAVATSTPASEDECSS